MVDFYGLPDDIDEGVRFRIDAQRVLSHGARRFLFLLDEGALHTSVGGPGVMQEQLRALVEFARQPRVHLGIVPQNAPYTVPRNNGFTIYDDRLVTVATYTAELTLSQRHEVAVYGQAFDRLLALAVKASAAERMIERVLADQEET